MNIQKSEKTHSYSSIIKKLILICYCEIMYNIQRQLFIVFYSLCQWRIQGGSVGAAAYFHSPAEFRTSTNSIGGCDWSRTLLCIGHLLILSLAHCMRLAA